MINKYGNMRMDAVKGIRYEGCGKSIRCTFNTSFITKTATKILLSNNNCNCKSLVHCGVPLDSSVGKSMVWLCQDCQAKLGLIW